MPRRFESVQLSRRAELDLADIYAYTVAHWSVDQPNCYVTDMREAIDRLVAGTTVGHNRAEVAAAYLCYRIGSHVIFYRETEHILVVRVLHVSMDLPQHLSHN